MVFSGVSKEKDLLGGPTNPSPHVGGALAPNDWGINGHPPYSTTPAGRTNPYIDISTIKKNAITKRLKQRRKQSKYRLQKS